MTTDKKPEPIVFPPPTAGWGTLARHSLSGLAQCKHANREGEEQGGHLVQQWCLDCGRQLYPPPAMQPDADRLRAAIARLGTTQRGLARLLELDERQVRRYCAGQVPVPKVVWLAIEILEGKP